MKIAIGVQGRLGAYLNTMVDELKIDNKGEYLRQLFGKYEEECLVPLLKNQIAPGNSDTPFATEQGAVADLPADARINGENPDKVRLLEAQAQALKARIDREGK